MFYANLNGNTFFSTGVDLDEYTLTTAKISKVANAAGSFAFTIPPCNVAYSQLNDLIDYVDVYRDETRLFSGRILSQKEQFDGQLYVKCESLFAVLNDSIIRPFTHENATVEHLVSVLITQHNAQVSDDKKITSVKVTIDDKDFIAYREYESYESTMTRLQDLITTYGGYMDIVKTDNGLQLEWVQNYTELAGQTIDFGVNLLDLTIEENSEEIITALIPLGAYLEDEEGYTTNKRLTVADVNDGSDIIYADEAYIEKYGYITGINIWDEVYIASNLLTKAKAYLNEKCAGKITINAKAVDLADAGYSVESFQLGTLIKVVSEPHGLLEKDNQWFECTKISLDLLRPENNKLTLGSVKSGYIRDMLRKANRDKADGKVYADYKIGESLALIKGDISNIQITYESLIEQLPNMIRTSVTELTTETFNSYNSRITTVESATEQLADSYTIWFGQNGKINTWFQFDENYFSIRKNGQSVYSRQDNDSYEFCDVSGTALLEINTQGVTAPTVNVSGQLKLTSGSTDQWAIRKGAHISGIGYNMDDVWIGG